MSFKPTVEDLKRSQKCPAGMHRATLITVDDEYFNDKGTSIQKCEFETENGHIVPFWFNDKMMGMILEFVSAADKTVITEDMLADMDIELREYKGKAVALSVSHVKDKNNKLQAQIDNFFNEDKVPF